MSDQFQDWLKLEIFRIAIFKFFMQYDQKINVQKLAKSYAYFMSKSSNDTKKCRAFRSL